MLRPHTGGGQSRIFRTADARNAIAVATPALPTTAPPPNSPHIIVSISTRTRGYTPKCWPGSKVVALHACHTTRRAYDQRKACGVGHIAQQHQHPQAMRHQHGARKPAPLGQPHAPSSKASKVVHLAPLRVGLLGVPLSSRWISAFDRGSRVAPADNGAGPATQWSATSGQEEWEGVCPAHRGVCPAHRQSSSECAIQHRRDE